MMKNYNIAADLLVLAKAYYNKGQKRDAVKLFVRAMDEGDSEELIEYLDDSNQSLDPTVEQAPAEEVLSDDVIDEILEEAPDEEEAPIEETEEVDEIEEPIESEGEEPAEEETEEVSFDDAEELPEVEDVVSKVMAKKVTLANLKSLSGTKEARKAAMAKFLKK
jgi:hypothetical protein